MCQCERQIEIVGRKKESGGDFVCSRMVWRKRKSHRPIFVRSGIKISRFLSPLLIIKHVKLCTTFFCVCWHQRAHTLHMRWKYFRQWNAMHVRKAQCAKWKVAVVLLKLEISLNGESRSERARASEMRCYEIRKVWLTPRCKLFRPATPQHIAYFLHFYHGNIKFQPKRKMNHRMQNEMEKGSTEFGQILCKHIFQW